MISMGQDKEQSKLQTKEFAGLMGKDSGSGSALQQIYGQNVFGGGRAGAAGSTFGLTDPGALTGAAAAMMATKGFSYQDVLDRLMTGNSGAFQQHPGMQQGLNTPEQAIIDQTMALANVNPTLSGRKSTMAGTQAAVLPQIAMFQEKLREDLLNAQSIQAQNNQAGAQALLGLGGLSMPQIVSGQKSTKNAWNFGIKSS